MDAHPSSRPDCEADETSLEDLLARVAACRVCAGALTHPPRPVVQIGRRARILVIGQAPGTRVHASGRAWDDDSGDRLRGWTGLADATFYNAERVAHMPSGFCYPGKGTGGDLPPRRECAPLWHAPLRAHMPEVRLTLLVGLHAQKRYLPRGFAGSLTQAVARWRDAPQGVLPLPHPSWRSRLWMAHHPWFEAELLPDLRARVEQALASAQPAKD